MTRPLSYLSDATLDAALTTALAAARRLGHGSDLQCNWCENHWIGEQLPRVVAEVMFEYVQRHRRPPVASRLRWVKVQKVK